MMFVAHDVLLDIAFGVARPRLVSLASSRAFVDASRAAYQEGLVSLIRAGAASSPAESEPTSRLAQVRFLPPVERAHTTTIGLRWEASGLSAGLFPVLDADITLAAAGEHSATLTVAGIYRSPCRQPRPSLLAAPVLHGVAEPPVPPPGPPGPDLGPVADAAVRALLRYAAVHLAGLVT